MKFWKINVNLSIFLGIEKNKIYVYIYSGDGRYFFLMICFFFIFVWVNGCVFIEMLIENVLIDRFGYKFIVRLFKIYVKWNNEKGFLLL